MSRSTPRATTARPGASSPSPMAGPAMRAWPRWRSPSRTWPKAITAKRATRRSARKSCCRRARSASARRIWARTPSASRIKASKRRKGRRAMKLDQVWRGALACALALVAMAAPAARGDEAFSPAQKSAIDQAIHDYLLAHPETVLDALKAAQEKSDREIAAEAQRQIAVRRQELVADPDDLVQ